MSRTRNMSSREFCRYCGNSGMTVVGESAVGTDQAAPCPKCERGFDVEFPSSGSGPWGADGFWQGKPSNIQPLYDASGGRVPPEVRRQLAQEAREALRAVSAPRRGRPTLDAILPGGDGGSEASATDEGEQERVA